MPLLLINTCMSKKQHEAMLTRSLWVLFGAVLLGDVALAFTAGPAAVVARPHTFFDSSASIPHTVLFSSSTQTTEPTSEIQSSPQLPLQQLLMKRDRYVATNRFAVRRDKQAKFEQRWATRKSKLAVLDGFRYFHLMRRVTRNDDHGTASYAPGVSDEEAHENYVSFTIWDKKSDFSAWRSGEAFKEAHGGTSIAAFLSTMMNSALVLRGAPRPAFYDGLMPEVGTLEATPTVDGWRNVEADGVTTLPAECFVELIKYFVPSDAAAPFEKEYAALETSAKNADGFVTRTLLRRDARAKG